MERDDRPTVATFLCDAAPAVGVVVTLGESAAHHARVKRLELGDLVRLTNGAGATGVGAITSLGRNALEISVDRANVVDRPSPIHLRVPIGDRDRMLWLAEKATELGIDTWQAVHFRRSASVSSRGEGPAFADKVRARMVSALEQSGGAWLPKILPETKLEGVTVDSGSSPILLDVSGEPLAAIVASRDTSSPVILFGPEGGLESSERELLTNQGWRLARLASSILRFETAGLAAVAVCRNMQMLEET